MPVEQLRRLLDDPALAAVQLARWGVHDVQRAHQNLVNIAVSGITLDLMVDLCGQLAEHLPGTSDPDRALNNLERFIASARNPLSLATLFERDREALPILLRIMSSSQHLSDVLVTDPDAYDLLRLTEGQPVAREWLVGELAAEVAALGGNDAAVMQALRRFKRRETLRIAYGDLIRNQRVEVVTRQISYLADAICEAALQAAWRRLVSRAPANKPLPTETPRMVVLALGKLGGVELNYSSDIDLMFLYDVTGSASARHDVAELCDRWAKETVRLLTTPTELGIAFRVDLRLRPDGGSGPMVTGAADALHYYDNSGRTWERQTFVKARACAGDIGLGQSFLAKLEPWIYRRYLSRADITGIKALKRRIELRSQRDGGDELDVKTGRGGLRDIEFVIQFLQLLNGGDLPALRTGNTVEAIAQLEACGCLTHQERTLLAENYAFLRQVEHRLQLLFDLQTHRLPADPVEQRRVALRLGYGDNRAAASSANPARVDALQQFWDDYRQKTEVNRKILDHLLHDAFSDDEATAPETDLVLDPEPAAEQTAQVLGKYRFQDVPAAYHNLMDLAQERIRFLSTRRCRHFLAAIAPRLLQAISLTPDPDFTLVNLCQVSDSLGGKGVLWELFSFHPPSLRLYVELCSCSQYLSGILITNPGMLDELLDSLLLDRLPSAAQLAATLAELTQGAEDLDPILHSFKNAQQLRVGVRDILGKELIESTTGALSDIAETCLNPLAATEYNKLLAKFGEPVVDAPPPSEDETQPPTLWSPQVKVADKRVGQPCQFAILALGKFGGRELNYYSDLDVMFVYEAEGQTRQTRRNTRGGSTTTNQHFFSELGQRIIKRATQLGPFGRLYQIDARLRPTGRSGALSISLGELERYFARGEGQLWERQALCKARVAYGGEAFAQQVMDVVHRCAYRPGLSDGDLGEICEMRAKLADTAEPGNLKRGPGGLVDIEFIVQALQMRHGSIDPTVRVPGTLAALTALCQSGILSPADYEYFAESFRFLRTIEARLRLMSTTARDDLPQQWADLAKLASLLGYASADNLLFDCRHYTSENRRRFMKMLAGREPSPV